MPVKVRLYIRPSLPDGNRPFLDPVFTANHKLSCGVGVLNGRKQKFEKFVYYLRYLTNGKRVWEPVGGDPALALEERRRTENRLEGIALGNLKADESEPKLTPLSKPTIDPEAEAALEPASRSEPKTERKLLSAAIEKYLEGKRDAGKKKKTMSAYTTALQYFQESCTKTYVEEIERVDVLRFHRYLRDDKEQSARSCSNKFCYLMSFLKEEGIRGLVKKEDWPQYQEDDPEIYEKEDLDAFFAVCTDQERLWFEFFLQTGMREQEVIYCRPENVNLKHGTIFVRRNDLYNWTAKAYRGREIPISAWLAAKLAARKLPASAKLLFGTSTGNPKLDFLDCCKSIAKRAGLNPDDWWLHKFRATFATMHLQAGVDFRTVQKWLGHVDSASTLRYLRPARGKEVQEKVNQTWASLGGAG